MVIFVYQLKTMDMKTIIYTVIPYFSNGEEVNQNDVKSFLIIDEAYSYGNTLRCCYDVIKNELN